MTTSSGASACTPKGFSALVSPPLSVLPPPPPLAQPVSREPPPAAATETRTARWRNRRREYWFGVPMDLSPLRDRGTQAVRRMRPAYRASMVLLRSYPPGTLAHTYTG